MQDPSMFRIRDYVSGSLEPEARKAADRFLLRCESRSRLKAPLRIDIGPAAAGGGRKRRRQFNRKRLSLYFPTERILCLLKSFARVVG